MRAVTFARPGGIEVLEISRVKRPVPGEGQLLVRNEFVGVNFIDTYFRSGLYPRPAMPSGLGEEGAGVVEAVGPGVTEFAKGDRVGYVTRSHLGGSFAEFTSVAASVTVKLPDGVTTKDAAAVLLQGLTALSQATVCVAHELKPGAFVLVHAAAGGTGQMLAQICSRHLGAHVIGTTGTESKAEVARAAGCKDVILYTKEDVAARVAHITGGRGVKVAFDGVGKATFDASLKSLGYFGWLVSFGNASGKPEPLDIMRLSEKCARVMRPSVFNTISADPAVTQRLMVELLGLVKDGVIKPQVHKVWPLEEVGQAHAALEGGGTHGKLLLTL